MKISIGFFLIFIILENIKSKKFFSISSFLNHIKENGYYDVITIITHSFGDDIAIDFCKEIYQTNDCEVIVNNYIPKKSATRRIGPKANFDNIIYSEWNILLREKSKNEIIEIKNKLKKKYMIE